MIATTHREDSPNTQLCYARENASDKALVLAAVSGTYGFLSVILVDAGRRGFLHRHESPMVPQRATMMMFIGEMMCARAFRRETGSLATASSLITDRRRAPFRGSQIYDIIPPSVSKGKRSCHHRTRYLQLMHCSIRASLRMQADGATLPHVSNV